jgi:23S rRNA (uracil1939-C5)-methyltransferase
MLAALDAGWRGATGLRRVTTEARDLFRRPMTDLAGFDAVVMDPPRAGAAAQAEALAARGPERIACVSCDPATFARDAATLVAGGYRLGPVHVVDQFRWSAHVELAAVLERV